MILKVLEAKADQIVGIMGGIKGVQDLGVFRVIGQPNLNYAVDRPAAARFGINVGDVQDAIQTAVGGGAVSQVLQGEARYDLVVRYQKPYRDTREAIEDIRLLSPSGERVSLAQLTQVKTEDGAEEIYREQNQRYVAIKYSVRGRDLGSTVEEAIAKVNREVKLPPGYHLDWAGEYQSQKRANKRLMLVLPITITLIFIILYTMFRSAKWALLIMCNVTMAPVGGMLALLFTHTNFSVSSGVGFLALFGVSVQTGVIMLEYINQLRVRGHSIEESAVEGAVLQAASHHDDHAGGHAGAFAGGHLAWHRLGFAASFCHRHCGWPDRRAGDERLSAANSVCVDRGRTGRAANAGNGV